MADTKTYNGKWWIPTELDKTEDFRFAGTLTIEGDGSCSLLIKAQPDGNKSFESIPVFWGEDERGGKYTLFALTMTQWNVGKSLRYKAKYVICGIHILSMDEPFFDECHVEFPYLQTWTGATMLDIPQDYEANTFTIEYGKDHVYVEGKLETWLHYRVVDRNVCKQGMLEFTSWKETQYHLISEKHLSIKSFNKYIREFAQFLSLALYSKQNPSVIYFRKKGEENAHRMFFIAPHSQKPFDTVLIPLSMFRDRLSNFISGYHSAFDKIETLNRYLITSIHFSDFDAPIFIVVAQALEGYYQRFLKGKEGVSKRKWEALLNHFEDVKALRECNIDANIVKDTRDTYSHLYIEKDSKKSNVAEGMDLVMLTQKCRILLTCCLLKEIGMTTEEISSCFDRNILHFMVYNVKKYETEKQNEEMK